MLEVPRREKPDSAPLMVELPADTDVPSATTTLESTAGFNGMVRSMGRTFAVFDAPVDDVTAGDIAQTVVAAQAASIAASLVTADVTATTGGGI